MTSPISYAATGAALILAVGLAGCGNDAEPVTPDPAAAGATSAAASASPDAATAATPAGGEAGPASCGALSLVEGTTFSGDDLATCMVDYMAFAGSGASRMTSGTASSQMVWRMKDGYEAYAELDDGKRMALTGGVAWIDFGDTGWVRGRSVDARHGVGFRHGRGLA